MISEDIGSAIWRNDTILISELILSLKPDFKAKNHKTTGYRLVMNQYLKDSDPVFVITFDLLHI